MFGRKKIKIKAPKEFIMSLFAFFKKHLAQIRIEFSKAKRSERKLAKLKKTILEKEFGIAEVEDSERMLAGLSRNFLKIINPDHLGTYFFKLQKDRIFKRALAFSIILAVIANVYIQNSEYSMGATYYFHQTKWQATPTGAYATHANQTGFEDYVSKTANISFVDGVGPTDNNVTISAIADSEVDAPGVGILPVPVGGDGSDGAITISAAKNISTDTIAAGRTCADGISYNIISLTANTATLSGTPPAGCFSAGDQVMLANMQGDGAHLDNVGNYEFLEIQSVSGNQVTFTENKTKYYGNGASDDTNIGAVAGDTWETLTVSPISFSSGGSLVYPGSGDYIYAFRGAVGSQFWAYSISNNNWTTFDPTDAPAAIAYGGTLVYPGSGDYIYATRGGATTFWAYSISNNNWTTFDPTDAPGNFGQEASLVYPGTGDYMYALQGSTAVFWAYSISNNNWTTLDPTDAPAVVGTGASLVYPGAGDYIYAFRGAVTTTFWAYSISNNNWTTFDPTDAPGNVDRSASLVYPGSGDLIYATGANNTTNFWAYSISNNNWTTFDPTDPPGNIYVGSDMAYVNSGNYIYVSAGSSTTFRRYYLPKQRVILQRIPQYTDVTIQGTGSLTADAWNGSKGGVLAFLANGTVAIADGGSITMSGKGYRNGQNGIQGESYNKLGSNSTAANLGGGGNSASGSGGGGYGTVGENSTGTGGGTYGSADLAKLFMGSGGGGQNNGDNGAGGGAVYIGANSLTVNGTAGIVNNGTAANNLTGGGAGGSIYLYGNTLTLGTGLITATGGAGVSAGNGGDGRIHVKATTSTGSTSPTLDPSVLATVYYSSRIYESSVFDTGHKTSAWGNFEWTNTLNGQTISMKARTCDDASCSGEDVSKDWDSVCTNITSGSAFSTGDCATVGDRYVQYQATLQTADTSVTPVLDTVTMHYSYYPTDQNIVSSWYDAGDPSNVLSGVHWNEDVSLPAGTEIKFQVATAPDSLGSPGTSTGFVGPDGTGTTYFYATQTDCAKNGQAVTCVVPNAINVGDGTNDQWIAYKVFLYSDGQNAPQLDDAKLQYVVNAPPELQIVNASQSTDGYVTVVYNMRDIDTVEGVDPNQADVTLQYCTADCTGTPTWADAATVMGHVGLNQSMGADWAADPYYTITWNSKADYSNETNADFKIRVKAYDNEIANHTGYATSNAFSFNTINPPEVQTVSASQGSIGTVVVNYEVKDPDTTNTAAATPGFVEVTLQYCIADCAGTPTWTDAVTVEGDGSVSATGAFVAKSMTWTPKTDYDEQYNATNFKVRVKVDDSEAGGYNLDYAESNIFTLDTSDPTNVSILVNHTKASEQLTMTTPSDDSSYQMMLSESQYFTGASQEPFVSPYTYALNPDPVSVYLRIIDEYGNYTDAMGITPSQVTDLTFYDITEVAENSYKEFIAWGVINNVGLGFASYDIYRSEDNVTYAKIGATTSVNFNYYLDTTVLPDTHYYYKVTAVDVAGNTSDYSDFVEDTPDGQGSSDSTGPVISTSEILEANVNTTSAKITWTTDELSDSSVGYSTQAECDAYVADDDPLDLITDDCPYRPIRGSASLVTDHEIILTGLAPDTTYYVQIMSRDVLNNQTAVNQRARAGNPIEHFTFSTHPGPAISNVRAMPVYNNQATITWETTTDSSTYVVYYADAIDDDVEGIGTLEAGELALPIEIGNPNLVGGTEPFIHSQLINDLTEYRYYYFYVKSIDHSNNVATDDNGGSYYRFRTDQDSLPPVLSNIDTPIINNTSAAIYWSTNEPSTSIVNYSDDNGDTWSTESVLTYDESHYVILGGLSPNTDYIFTVTSADINGNTSDPEEGSFTTLMNPDQQHPPLAALTATIDETEYDLTDTGSASIFVPTVLTDVSSVIEFETDQIAMCDIQYRKDGQEYSPTDFIIEETGYNINHSMHIMSLVLNTKYYYKIECVDNLPEGQTGSVNSTEFTFTTLEKQYGETDAQALGDSTAPVLSGVAVGSNVGESVIVTWSTDEAANSLVTYSLDGSEISRIAGDYLAVSDKANYSTSHTVTINDLIPSSKYVFSAISYDAAGNVGQSGESSFTTKAPSSLSAVKVISRSLTEAVITWETGGETSSIVEYGLTTAYGEVKESKTATKLHEIVISDLQAGQLYHFRVKGEDAEGNMFASTDNTFQQKSPPQISGFAVSEVAERSAKIEFATNVPTDVLVTYTDAQDEKNSGSQGFPTLTTKHVVELKSLVPGRIYALEVKVRDEEGNEAEEIFPSFTTIADENPPEIEQIKTDSALTQSDKVQTIISWITDEPSVNKLIYKEGVGGEEKEVEVSSELTTKNSAVFTIFKPGTVYYFKVKSADESSNETTSQEYALLTPRRRENIIQVIIAQFEDIFQWTKM